MIVNDAAPANAAARNASAPGSQPSGSAFAGQLASVLGASSDGTSATGTDPMSGLRIVSGVEATLPNGLTLGIFHFEEGSDSAAPSAADEQSTDDEMIRSLEQMMRDFGYPPTAAAQNGASPSDQSTTPVTA